MPFMQEHYGKDNLKTAAFIGPDDQDGYDCHFSYERLMDYYGVEMKGVEYFNWEDTDFYPIVTKTLKSKPDFIVTSPSPPGHHRQHRQGRPGNGLRRADLFAGRLGDQDDSGSGRGIRRQRRAAGHLRRAGHGLAAGDPGALPRSASATSMRSPAITPGGSTLWPRPSRTPEPTRTPRPLPTPSPMWCWRTPMSARSPGRARNPSASSAKASTTATPPSSRTVPGAARGREISGTAEGLLRRSGARSANRLLGFRPGARAWGLSAEPRPSLKRRQSRRCAESVTGRRAPRSDRRG